MKDGRMQLAYHYHFTDEYPYSLGCYTGTPVAGARPPGPNRPRPQ